MSLVNITPVWNNRFLNSIRIFFISTVSKYHRMEKNSWDKTKLVKIIIWWSCCARNDYLFCGNYLLRFRTRTLVVVSQFSFGEWGGKESLTEGSRTIKTFIKNERRILQNSIWWSSCTRKGYFVVFTYCASGP